MRIGLFITALIAVFFSAFSKSNKLPQPLKKGDKIAVVAPGDRINDAGLKIFCDSLVARGYEPVIMGKVGWDEPGDRYREPAGMRAKHLSDALRDPEIKAIIPVRGGYGSVQLLPYLNIEDAARNPKWIVGYSDISVLQSFMNKAGVASIHGPMGVSFKMHGDGSQESRDMLFRILESSVPEDITVEPDPRNRFGKASGKLLGGNFIVLNGLSESDYDVFSLGKNEPVILFVEEVEEKIYAVERMLQRLHQSGNLKNLQGIIFCEFSDCIREESEPYSSVEECVEYWLREWGYYDDAETGKFPVVYGFPVGHESRNLPLVEGVMVELEANPRNTTLRYVGNDEKQTFKAGDKIDANGIDIDDWFVSFEIPDEVFARMKGKSFGTDCSVPREELRYLQVLHKNLNGETLLGEIVCNRNIANDLLEIFRELYDISYPIERMVLIDEYGAQDVPSMQANNSSCFNFRKIAGSNKLSYHATGNAIDINPLYNPWVKKRDDGTVAVSPEEGRKYIRRDNPAENPYLLTADDPAVKIFKAHGFTWGGDWTSIKDYQHFEKEK